MSDIAVALERSRSSQPLWALVPADARARYLRRAAMAVLDEVDALADLLAEEAALPRTEALLAELLPSVAGFHGLADEGPRAVRDARLGRRPVLRAGRSSLLLQTPVGVAGIVGGPGSPWAEPALEVAAALLAGNGALLSSLTPRAAARLVAALERAGVPEGLVGVVDAGASLAGCDRCIDETPVGPSGTILVLDGAPLERVIPGALWAAFAGAGRGRAAVGRAVVVPSVAAAVLDGLQAGARRLRVGDPRLPETEVGPLRSEADLAEVEALVQEAVDAGARLVCGGRVEVPGVQGAFFAPVVLRNVAPDSSLLSARVPGPVLAVVETGSEADAIDLARSAAGTVSVWAGDRGHGERVARTLRAELTWVNEHGQTVPAAPVRVARFVETRQLASQPTRLRSARWLPYDPALVKASLASSRLMHGRESERLEALREGALPLLQTGVRLLREAAGR